MAGDDTLRTRFEALLSEVDQYDSRDREMSLDVQPPQSTKPSAKWRQRVRAAISYIVDFRHYSWTEINDVSDKQYALYNLRQINDYFKGFVFISPMRQGTHYLPEGTLKLLKHQETRLSKSFQTSYAFSRVAKMFNAREKQDISTSLRSPISLNRSFVDPLVRLQLLTIEGPITLCGTESGIIPMELASLNGAVPAKLFLRALSTRIEV